MNNLGFMGRVSSIGIALLVASTAYGAELGHLEGRPLERSGDCSLTNSRIRETSGSRESLCASSMAWLPFRGRDLRAAS